jgi:putative DNA primase/helicase
MTPLQWALAYARRGWPVFPCNPKTKRPMVKGAVDPKTKKEIPGTGGVKKATTDPAQIEAWWGKWPQAMIGLACGQVARVFAVDFDPGADRESGELLSVADLQRRLETELGVKLPATWRDKTPSGGQHAFFQMSEFVVGNRGDLLGNVPPRAVGLEGGDRAKKNDFWQIDIRGEGGYVILPPSTRPDGETYAWLVKPKSAEDLPAWAPLELVDCIMRRGRWAEDRASSSSEEKSPRQAGAPARSISQRARVAGPPKERASGLPSGSILADVEAELRKYALSALDGECEAVAGVGRGERNNRLNTAALKLATYIKEGLLRRPMVEAALEDAAARSGLVKEDGRRPVLATIESGIEGGLLKARDLGELRAQVAQRLARRALRNNARGESRDHASSSSRPSAATSRPSPTPDESPHPPDDAAASAFSPAPPAANQGQESRILPNDNDHAEPAGSGDHFGSGAAVPGSAGGNGGRSSGRFGGRTRGGDKAAPDDDGLDLQLAFFPQTDLGNAERFAVRNKSRLRYCPQLGWLYWTGELWSRTGAFQKVTEAIHECVRAIQREADAVGRHEKDYVAHTKYKGTKHEEEVSFSDMLRGWGRASEDGSHMSKIAGEKGGNAAAYLHIDQSELDADIFKINVENGTLVLHRGATRDGDCIEFKRHDPADLITKIAPVRYDPNATCQVYDGFLAQVQPDAAMRRFLHQWGGYSLTGDVTEQKFAFLYGKGRNGKSTWIEALAYLMGDYGRAVPVETFVTNQQRSASGPSPDLAMLRGVRFAHTTEPEKNVKISEGVVKLVTGGDQVPCRELNMPFFMLHPQFKLTMSGNYKPVIAGGEETHGIWRRYTLMPWSVTIDESKIDKELPTKLRAEASGILNRLLDGLRDWNDNGLVTPAAVHDATEANRVDSDPLGRFQASCLVPDAGGREQSSKVFEVYLAWCRANGEREWSARGFAQAMTERGMQIKHSNVNWWLNVRLVATADDFVDHENKPRQVADRDAPAAGEAVPI